MTSVYGLILITPAEAPGQWPTTAFHGPQLQRLLDASGNVTILTESASCRDSRKDSVDWAAPGRSTLGAIRNQEECGSCYAHVAVAAVEADYALATPENRDGANTVFSPVLFLTQQVIDYFGCEGGDYYSVWTWLRDWMAGVCMSEQYPSRVPEAQGESLTCRGASPPVRVT
jgi:hypothetical protein